MKTIHEKLNDVELDISNLTMFISQCMEKLGQRTREYIKLQEEIYIEDGLNKLNQYANYAKTS